MDWYNGWSPDERRAGNPVQQAAVRSGAVPRPLTCSICDHTPDPTRWSDNPVWFHDENFAEPLAAYHVCRRCHLTLHRRFKAPKLWRELVARHGSSGRWFEALTMDSASLRQPFEVTYPNGLPPA